MKQNKIPRNEYIRKPVGKTNPYKHDVLYTNLGQWKYPGQVTRIPSNDITMQGVDYPVYGEDDLGYGQMMYPGMDYTFPGQYVTEIPMAQKGKQVEDRDSWLENIAEVFDPTGISSWDDVYRAYKNTGLSGETALEAFGAIPLLGKIGKSGKIITGGFGLLQDAVKASKYLPASKQQQFIDQAFKMYQNYNKAGGKELDETLGATTKILKDKIPYINPSKWKSSDKAINIANKSFKAGRLSDAVQAALGAKDDSGFTWDMRQGEVPKYGGRNIFPQIELGEHGDFAYGGDPSLPNITGHYPFGGQNTKTHTHMKEGGWLDEYQDGGFNIYNDPNTLFVQQHSRQVFNPNFNNQEPVTGIDKNLLVRQQFKESTFNPKAISPAKARGLAQIKENVETDAIKAGVLKKGEDIFDPEVNAKVQKWYMNDLYDSSFINKPGQKDSVKLAKALAAYNWGRGNTLKHLNEQKKKGIDIYNSYNWVNSLPKETKDYVNKILLKKDSKFEKEFEKAYEKYPYKEEGGEIGEDEFRRGGPYTPPKLKRKAKKYGTSKNIQSSINKLFTRNYDVFGPGGKNIYNPNVYKTGGWLDFVD
jgi:hypothetical protein